MQRIPLTLAAAQRFSVVFDAVQYNITLRWQPLSAHWYISVTAGGVEITLGRQVVTGALVSPYPQLGAICVLSLHGDQNAPQRQAWGETHGLFWLSPAEVEAL